MRQGLSVPGGSVRSRNIDKYLVTFVAYYLAGARCEHWEVIPHAPCPVPNALYCIN